MCAYVYIYIYIEREREIYTHICTYIYTHMIGIHLVIRLSRDRCNSSRDMFISARLADGLASPKGWRWDEDDPATPRWEEEARGGRRHRDA